MSGDLNLPRWQEWLARLTEKDGYKGKMIHGALAEIVASKWLAESSIDALYYTVPVACELDDSGYLSGVVVASKAGLNRVQACQWIDASDEGILGRLSGAHHRSVSSYSGIINIYASDWCGECMSWQTDGYTATLAPGFTDNERCLRVQWYGEADGWWADGDVKL